MLAGLDAIIVFAKNPDSSKGIRDTNIVSIVGKAFQGHSANASFVWRMCMAFSLLAVLNQETAADIARLQLHDTLVNSFESFSSDPLVQQQILKYLAALSIAGPKSKATLQVSSVVVNFLKDFIAAKDALYAEAFLSKRSEVRR